MNYLMTMKEIRFHGRGGQGAVSASNILANSAFLEGRYVQSFLLIGAERRGAPVMAYTRITLSLSGTGHRYTLLIM